ncbi:hypothetical protein K2173_009822 [Erythroxylum novogranatense]|uniref:Non-specific lipid-transfer protein n=1 Tax=Erythroxylum novogranatense TaxID=1862640 RepID=A0AAV8SZY9_9ROSI|nr:hypothetical protein K2173_009822 [Erythroxylum novogranatense]
MACLKLVCLVLACMLVAAPVTVRAVIACNTVSSKLAPCINFLKNGGTVPATCCGGVTSVQSSARTTADRQQVCECLKQAAGRITGLDTRNANALPKICKVNIPYPISTTTNCKTVRDKDSFF